MVGVAATASGRSTRRETPTSALREQVSVAGAQWMSGVGNLVFAVVVARILSPQSFADLGAFLGAYVLLHLPAAGVGAGAALAPGDHGAVRRRLLLGGVVVGAAIAASTPWATIAFSVPPPIVLALAAAAPGAAVLGLERGILFHHRDRRAIATSLLAEPTGRLAIGVIAGMVVGATGAAIAVTVAGYAALAAASRGVAGHRPAIHTTPERRGARTATTATFVLFAVLQQQDLLFAKARLGAEAAGVFAALSTVGGAVAFATATIPLALLPNASRDEHAGKVALALTAAIGVVAAVAALVAGDVVVDLVLGRAYASAAPLLAPYVAAMAFLGVSRVLAARRCAVGRHGAVAGAVAAAFIVHVVLLLVAGTTPGAFVAITFTATATSAGLLSVPDGAAGRVVRRWRDAISSWTSRGDLFVIGTLTAIAVAVRMVSTRGLWVDEAITVAQAQQPFGTMLDQLGSVDVHPPLHHAMVWVLVRIAGTSEMVVRAPSILAGALLVPAVFGLANALYGRRTGLVAAAFVAIAPFAVWYSQEARMYSLFMLFATLAFWAQVAALRGDGRWAWVGYAAATAAMAWTQWFAIVPIAAQQIVFAGAWLRRRHHRTQRRRLLLVWAAALGASTALVLPLLPLALDQLGAYSGRSGAAVSAPAQAGSAASGLAGEVSVYAVGANAIWAVVGYHSDGVMTQLAALWPLLLLAAFAALGRGRSRRTTALLTCIAVPTILFVLAGLVKRDLFELRYFAGVVPLLLVLVARALTAVFHRNRTQIVAAAVAIVLLGVGLVDQQLNGANPRRYDFEGALERVRSEADPGDVVLYEPDYLAEVVEYYAPEMSARPIDERGLVDDGAATWVLATTRVADDEATSARVGDALADLEAERSIVAEFEVPNVHVWELRS